MGARTCFDEYADEKMTQAGTDRVRPASSKQTGARDAGETMKAPYMAPFARAPAYDFGCSSRGSGFPEASKSRVY